MSNGDQAQPIKPNWMSTSVFAEVRRIFEVGYGRFRCADCNIEIGPNSEMTLTWDHVVPRTRGGEDTATNLQPLCVPCNSRKNANPDLYWEKRFYFDGDIHLDRARMSQREYVYNQLMMYPQFSDPYSYYSGHLFCCCQIVGAGKTLGMLMVPFALNQLANERGPARPRVNRMLILAKSTPLRDQIAEELRTEPAQYGLVDHSPDVVVASSLDIFQSEQALARHDIFVSTQQLLWADTDGRRLPPDQLDRILRSFPLICFDEVHFASSGKVQELAYKASQSLTFGFTATPLRESDSSPRPMSNAYKLSVYGVRNAGISDNSMKGLGTNHSAWRQGQAVNPFDDIIVETQTDRIFLADQGEVDYDPSDPRHAQAGGNVQALTVAYEVVHQLKLKELEAVEDHSLSRHREFHTAAETRSSEINAYKGHAIVRVDNVRQCELVCDALNEYLSRHRDMYPREDGWQAACAHGGHGDHQAKPLDSNHPWFYAKRQGGRVNRRASRILVAIDLATEGINNKYVNTVGFASPVQAIRSVIQSIGRAVRSTHEVTRENGITIHQAPVNSLDNICVVTHARFTNNRRIIEQALHFMDDMEAHLRDVPDLDTFFDSQTDIGAVAGGRRGGQLHIAAKILAMELGCIAFCESRNLTDRFRNSVYRQAGATSDPQRDIVDDILDVIWSGNQNRLAQLGRELRITGVLPQRSLQLRETSHFNPTQEQLQRFAVNFWGQSWWDTLVDDLGSDRSLQFASDSMRAVTPRVGMYELDHDMRLDQVMEALRTEMLSHGFREMIPSRNRNRIEACLRTAFRQVTGDDNCFDSDEFNHHSVIYTFQTDARLRTRIIGFVAFQLAQAGVLQGLQTALNL